MSTEPKAPSKAAGVAEPLLAPPAPADTPPTAPQAGPIYNAFSSGLCDCCEGDSACPICLVSCYLPCFAHALAANGASGGKGLLGPLLMWFGFNAFLPGVSMVALATLARVKLCRKYGMPPKPCTDCCAQVFCHCCATAQELRHIRACEGQIVAGDPSLRAGLGDQVAYAYL